jgi:hypothetical protein
MPQWPSVQSLSNISTLTSVVIYFITMLDVPLEVLLKIDSIQCAFPWALVRRSLEEMQSAVGACLQAKRI